MNPCRLHWDVGCIYLPLSIHIIELLIKCDNMLITCFSAMIVDYDEIPPYHNLDCIIRYYNSDKGDSLSEYCSSDKPPPVSNFLSKFVNDSSAMIRLMNTDVNQPMRISIFDDIIPVPNKYSTEIHQKDVSNVSTPSCSPPSVILTDIPLNDLDRETSNHLDQPTTDEVDDGGDLASLNSEYNGKFFPDDESTTSDVPSSLPEDKHSRDNGATLKKPTAKKRKRKHNGNQPYWVAGLPSCHALVNRALESCQLSFRAVKYTFGQLIKDGRLVKDEKELNKFVLCLWGTIFGNCHTRRKLLEHTNHLFLLCPSYNAVTQTTHKPLLMDLLYNTNHCDILGRVQETTKLTDLDRKKKQTLPSTASRFFYQFES